MVGERPQQPVLRIFGGLVTQFSEVSLPDFMSPDLRNADLLPRHAIKQRKGYTILGVPAGEDSVEAVMMLNQPEQSRGWLYIIAGQTIYRVPEPGTWTWQTPTHASGYSLVAQDFYGRENSRYYDEVSTEYPSVIYLPRSNGAPLILLGQTSATGDIITLPAGQIETAPAAGDQVKGYPSSWTDNWPTVMRVIGRGRNERMYALGFPDNPNLLGYSEVNVQYNFMLKDMSYGATPDATVDGGYIEIRPGDGDRLVSIADMYTYTVIFKERRTLIYGGDPGDPTGFEWFQQADLPVGCVNDRAWAKVGNDLYFWSLEGPRNLAAVNQYGDIEVGSLCENIQDDVLDVAPDQLGLIRCWHEKDRRRVVWFVPSPTSTNNDKAFAYYYDTGQWSIWDGDTTNIQDVLTTPATESYLSRPLAGSLEDGVVQLDSGVIQGTDFYYITDWINFGELSDSTRALWLEVLYGDDGDGVTLWYQKDFVDTWEPIERIVRSVGAASGAWGAFTWGSTAWGTFARKIVRYDLDGDFKIIRFKWVGAANNLGAQVVGYRVEASEGGPRS